MRFVTRKNAAVDRIACPWLIRRHIDRDAEFLYVEPQEVERVAREADAAEGGDVLDHRVAMPRAAGQAGQDQKVGIVAERHLSPLAIS